MINKAVRYLLLMFCFSVTGYNQNLNQSFHSWISNSFDNFKGGVYYSFSDRSNQVILATASLAALSTYPFDQKVKSYTLDNGLLPKNISRFGDLYGGKWSHWILFSGIISTSFALPDSKKILYSRLEYSFLVIATNGTVTAGLKRVTGRERPNRKGYHSFPSGHTSHSFAIASIYNELFGPELGIPAYTIAAVVAISRINDNKHYLSDVIFGAGLGTIIGRGFARQYRENNQKIKFSTSNGRDLIIVYAL